MRTRVLIIAAALLVPLGCTEAQREELERLRPEGDPNEDVNMTPPSTAPLVIFEPGLITPATVDPNCNTCPPKHVVRIPVPQATPDTVATGTPPVPSTAVAGPNG